MAMGADVIVAQPLTITGSIGVVLGKFNLEELYRRIGYMKTPISRGRCAPGRARAERRDHRGSRDASRNGAREAPLHHRHHSRLQCMPA